MIELKRMLFRLLLKVVLTIAGPLFLSNCSLAKEPMLADSPRPSELKISPSGHYFTYRGKTVMLVGDSGTQCVLQNLNTNYQAWIDDLNKRGIKAAHVWAFVAPRQKQDGSKVEQRYGYVYPGATPWKRKTSGPKATDQLYQWDLTQFDEGSDRNKHYWPRIRDIASYTKHKGMCLGITLFFGWPKHDESNRNDWIFHPFHKANGGHLTDKTDTVHIHSPGTEVFGKSWSDSWPKAKKTQWIWERYCQKMINELSPYRNVFFVYKDERSYERDGWQDNMDDHIVDFFRRRGSLVLVDWKSQRDVVDVIVQASHRTDKNSLSVKGFNDRPARPVVLFEGHPYTLGHRDVRISMWTYSIGGGHFFFHDDEKQGTRITGIMGYDPQVTGGVKPLTTYDWLGHLSRFFNERVENLDAMSPLNKLIVSGRAYCLANPGHEYLVYQPTSKKAFRVSLKAGTYRFEWFDPRSGKIAATGTITAKGYDQIFNAPFEGDAVVYLKLISN